MSLFACVFHLILQMQHVQSPTHYPVRSDPASSPCLRPAHQAKPAGSWDLSAGAE